MWGYHPTNNGESNGKESRLTCLAALNMKIGEPIQKPDLLTKVYWEMKARAVLPELPLTELCSFRENRGEPGKSPK